MVDVAAAGEPITGATVPRPAFHSKKKGKNQVNLAVQMMLYGSFPYIHI